MSAPGLVCGSSRVCSQKKILLIRDNSTSFTQTKIIQTEQQDLRTGLITMLYFIKMNKNTMVQVDPHSSFKTFKNDNTLEEHGITLEIGD